MPEAFPPDVEREAASAAATGDRERVDLPFVTIDPPGSRDLDQALHIERRGAGHRVSYAIADVGAFVAPGGALDREAHARGVTVYAPDHKTPLHPPVLSEGAASLLPGDWRPAVLWTLDLDADGTLASTDVRRAEVRSVAQHTYEDVPPEVAAPLAEVGEKRLRIERERGGVRLNVPEQEVVREGDDVDREVPRPARHRGAQRAGLAAHRHGRGASSCSTAASASCAPSRRPTRRASRGCAARRSRWGSTGPRPRRTRTSSTRSTRAAPRTPRSCRRPRASAAARATPPSTASRPPTPSTSPSPRPTRTPPRRCAASRTATSSSAASRRPPGTPVPDHVRAGAAGAARRDGRGDEARPGGRARRRRPRRGRPAPGPRGRALRRGGHRRRARAAPRPRGARPSSRRAARSRARRSLVRLERADPATRTVAFATVS